MRSSARVSALVAAVAFVIAASSCSPGRGAEPPSRAARAPKYATGVVAALARQSAYDASQYFGRDLSADDMAHFRSSIPATYGPDPKQYEARIEVDPWESDVATAHVAFSSAPSGVSFVVTLKWDSAAPYAVWRDQKLVRTVRGDWLVTDVGVAQSD